MQSFQGGIVWLGQHLTLADCRVQAKLSPSVEEQQQENGLEGGRSVVWTEREYICREIVEIDCTMEGKENGMKCQFRDQGRERARRRQMSYAESRTSGHHHPFRLANMAAPASMVEGQLVFGCVQGQQ
jgi:hypothetical protein